MVESWLRVSPPIQRYREPYQRNAKPGRANDEATMTAVSSSGVFFFLAALVGVRWTGLFALQDRTLPLSDITKNPSRLDLRRAASEVGR